MSLTNFEDVVRDFVKLNTDEELAFIYVGGEQPDFRKDDPLPGINIAIENLEIGTPEEDIEDLKPNVLMRQEVNNKSSGTTITQTLEGSLTVTRGMSYQLERGFSLGASVTASAEVDFAFGSGGIETTYSTEMNVSSTETQSETREETVAASCSVEVQPNTSVLVEGSAKAMKAVCPFSAQVVLTGKASIRFEEKIPSYKDGQGNWYYWFLDPAVILEDMKRKNGKYPEGYSVRESDGKAIYRIEGKTSGEFYGRTSISTEEIA